MHHLSGAGLCDASCFNECCIVCPDEVEALGHSQAEETHQQDHPRGSIESQGAEIGFRCYQETLLMSRIEEIARPPISSTVRQAAAAFRKKTSVIKEAMSVTGAMQVLRRSTQQRIPSQGCARSDEQLSKTQFSYARLDKREPFRAASLNMASAVTESVALTGAALRRDLEDDCHALKAQIDKMRVANTGNANAPFHCTEFRTVDADL
eukprot:1227769-Rhodomonas_salina.2